MIGGPDHGQQSDTLGHGQRKRGAQFGREKGRHDAPPRASAEQIDAGPMQRPCSGPGEEKAACRLAVQTLVHHIRDRWHALYLVDHHPPSPRDILALDQETFNAAFRKSPMKRAKLRGLQRNAAAMLKNSSER